MSLRLKHKQDNPTHEAKPCLLIKNVKQSHKGDNKNNSSSRYK